MSQIFLHLITGDPTIPYGASSRRSHGEQNHVGDPKRPDCYKQVVEYVFSGGRILAKHTHPALTLEEDLQQQLSSPLLLLRYTQALFLFLSDPGPIIVYPSQ